MQPEPFPVLEWHIRRPITWRADAEALSNAALSRVAATSASSWLFAEEKSGI